MSKTATHVDSSKFIAILAMSGFTPLYQSGFIKVSGKNGSLYIAKTKKVGRIDLSGFTVDDKGVVNLGAGAVGAVKQQIDFTQSECDILTTFNVVVSALGAPKSAEKGNRQAGATRTASANKVVRVSGKKSDAVKASRICDIIIAAERALEKYQQKAKEDAAASSVV